MVNFKSAVKSLYTVNQLNKLTHLNIWAIICQYIMVQDVPSKLTNYKRAMGIINRIFKPNLVQKHRRIKAYKTVTRPILVYAYEAWTVQETDKKILMAKEMTFFLKKCKL